ncbi:DUF6357 family protein [Georgenia sp. Z1491]|uniref:DUF6357 family protein n=1 Tax=Georgenia sp. Z1491 TaxID=3416707 RepID=UPI003CE6C33D
MTEVVFARGRWLPDVLREDGRLRLEIIGGADALGDARRFTIPFSEAHVARIREDLPRHVLLRAALLPLCYAAGSMGRMDEPAAVRLLESVLYGDEGEVDAVFETSPGDSTHTLISHGADPVLLDAGKAYAAAQSAVASTSWDLVREYEERRRGPLATPRPRHHRQAGEGALLADMSAEQRCRVRGDHALSHGG